MAGVQLQLTAMARGTAQLSRRSALAAPTGDWNRASTLPAANGGGDERRLSLGSGAAIASGAEAARSEGRNTLWLTGGRWARALAPLLKELGLDFEWAPELAWKPCALSQIQIRGLLSHSSPL